MASIQNANSFFFGGGTFVGFCDILQLGRSSYSFLQDTSSILAEVTLHLAGRLL